MTDSCRFLGLSLARPLIAKQMCEYIPLDLNKKLIHHINDQT